MRREQAIRVWGRGQRLGGGGNIELVTSAFPLSNSVTGFVACFTQFRISIMVDAQCCNLYLESDGDGLRRDVAFEYISAVFQLLAS